MLDETNSFFSPKKTPRGKLKHGDKVKLFYDPIESTLKISSEAFVMVNEIIKPDYDYRVIFWMGTHEGNQLKIKIV